MYLVKPLVFRLLHLVFRVDLHVVFVAFPGHISLYFAIWINRNKTHLVTP